MSDPKPNDGGPAFPMQLWNQKVDGAINVVQDLRGMSLRDYFAAHAPPMPADIARDAWGASQERAGGSGTKAENLMAYLDAKWRYRHADAMLKAREKRA